MGDGSWESLIMCPWSLGGLEATLDFVLKRPEGQRLAGAGGRQQWELASEEINPADIQILDC